MAPGVPCPCCGCRTLHERATFAICPVCFWEDDGTDAEDDDLNPNGVSLAEGRAAFRTWGATRSDLVHAVRPPTAEESTPATDHLRGRRYDRWATTPVGAGVAFGWVGPSVDGPAPRDGFLAWPDGRRLGLRVRPAGSVPGPTVTPEGWRPTTRPAICEVALPGSAVTSAAVLAWLRAGGAHQVEAVASAHRLGDLGPPGAGADGSEGVDDGEWSPRQGPPPLVVLGTRTFSAGGGGGDERWEACPAPPDVVAAWARDVIVSDVEDGDEVVSTGPASWTVRRRSAAGLVVRSVTVHDVTAPPTAPPAEPPPGTRSLVVWSSAAFPAAVGGAPVSRWRRRGTRRR